MSSDIGEIKEKIKKDVLRVFREVIEGKREGRVYRGVEKIDYDPARRSIWFRHITGDGIDMPVRLWGIDNIFLLGNVRVHSSSWGERRKLRYISFKEKAKCITTEATENDEGLMEILEVPQGVMICIPEKLLEEKTSKREKKQKTILEFL